MRCGTIDQNEDLFVLAQHVQVPDKRGGVEFFTYPEHLRPVVGYRPVPDVLLAAAGVGDTDSVPRRSPQLVSSDEIVDKDGLVLRDRGGATPLQARNEPHCLLVASIGLPAGARVHVYGVGILLEKPRKHHLPDVRDCVPDTSQTDDLFSQPPGVQAGFLVRSAAACRMPLAGVDLAGHTKR